MSKIKPTNRIKETPEKDLIFDKHIVLEILEGKLQTLQTLQQEDIWSDDLTAGNRHYIRALKDQIEIVRGCDL